MHIIANSVHRQTDEDVGKHTVGFVNNVDDFSPLSMETVQISTLHLFDNVIEPYNVLYLANTDTNTIEVVTIPPGQYNSLQFSTALQAAFNTQLGWSTTVAISSLTFKMTVTPLNPLDPVRYFLPLSEIVNSSNFTNPLDPASIPAETLNLLSGVHASQRVLFPGTLVHNVNLSGPSHVYVNSSAMGHSTAVMSGVGNTDFIGTIDLTNVPYGGKAKMVSTERQHRLFFTRGDRSLSDFDITLTDKHGKILTLPPNANVFVEMLAVKSERNH